MAFRVTIEWPSNPDWENDVLQVNLPESVTWVEVDPGASAINYSDDIHDHDSIEVPDFDNARIVVDLTS